MNRRLSHDAREEGLGHAYIHVAGARCRGIPSKVAMQLSLSRLYSVSVVLDSTFDE
jgi:hypothetical protein